MTSEKSIPAFDEATAEFFNNLFRDLMNGVQAQVIERMSQLEKSVEEIEKQIATLVLAYGEQAVFMEALVSQMAFASDEARKKFQEDVTYARKQMLEVMNDASKGFLAEQSPNLASALADMVKPESTDTDQ